MKLILHCGIHRTGSTSIQKNLTSNREALKRQGFLYPEIEGVSSPDSLPSRLNVEASKIARFFGEIETQASHRTHTVILSSEDLCRIKNFRFLKGVPKKYEIYVALYLRRQDLWLESWYNQNVKWPWDAEFSGSDIQYFIGKSKNFPWINYENLLGRIEEFVPLEKIHVRCIGEDNTTSSTDDFLSFCGIDSNLLQKEADKNQSLSSAKIDILRRIDIIALPGPARLKVLGALSKIKIQEDSGNRAFLTRAERLKILADFMESNDHVARRYFGRNKLFSDKWSEELNPALVSDMNAYQRYIPEILKKIAEE